jgi:hypothetical protein
MAFTGQNPLHVISHISKTIAIAAVMNKNEQQRRDYSAEGQPQSLHQSVEQQLSYFYVTRIRRVGDVMYTIFRLPSWLKPLRFATASAVANVLTFGAPLQISVRRFDC